ncbi:MAG: hypothetical protein ACI8Y4_003996 [Candidatus Poriferisodalaceae bacterium]|jgi:hypothetical protein
MGLSISGHTDHPVAGMMGWLWVLFLTWSGRRYRAPHLGRYGRGSSDRARVIERPYRALSGSDSDACVVLLFQAVAGARASDAVAAAEAMQSALLAAVWPGPALRVHVGVHLGEAEERVTISGRWSTSQRGLRRLVMAVRY